MGLDRRRRRLKELNRQCHATYFLQKVVVGLLRATDFDCLHHFAGRDDNAAEDFRLGCHVIRERGNGNVEGSRVSSREFSFRKDHVVFRSCSRALIVECRSIVKHPFGLLAAISALRTGKNP